MMECPDLSGQVLDGKYEMMRELGRGGMGTVYLAMHLGTERPVAIKVIAPQYMERAEFIERFRREARAAGRLRHPNVVNVTDFGFAETRNGQVAYLVMEYLDGCTLGEILDEEKNLPVGWTLDIIEQVSSAIHEAHSQGIIHRDLKPDNIWLEPNQRGGYTVKVLDFGIAKLEEQASANGAEGGLHISGTPTHVDSRTTTLGGGDSGTLADPAASNTHVGEGRTMAAATDGATVQLSPAASEQKTAIYEPQADQDTIGTKVISEPGTEGSDPDETAVPRTLYDSKSSSELTRVGAVLGTPLYMSPEQCRSEHLDPRSDIYSLGVIAYQMLAGSPPFEGDFKDVMEAHKTVEPPILRARKVRRKLKRAIHSALDKDPNNRPQTAEAFASQLRSRSEGIWGLLRRAMVIYSEHLVKFVSVSAFFSLPMIVLTLAMLALSFLKVSEMISDTASGAALGAVGLALSFAERVLHKPDHRDDSVDYYPIPVDTAQARSSTSCAQGGPAQVEAHSRIGGLDRSTSIRGGRTFWHSGRSGICARGFYPISHDRHLGGDPDRRSVGSTLLCSFRILLCIYWMDPGPTRRDARKCRRGRRSPAVAALGQKIFRDRAGSDPNNVPDPRDHRREHFFYGEYHGKSP